MGAVIDHAFAGGHKLRAYAWIGWQKVFDVDVGNVFGGYGEFVDRVTLLEPGHVAGIVVDSEAGHAGAFDHQGSASGGVGPADGFRFDHEGEAVSGGALAG